MTIEACITFCDAQNNIFAGVEYSGECYCGNSISGVGNGVAVSSTECNMPCTGNTLQPCGGPGRLNLFWSGDEPAPTAFAEIQDWDSLGCYSEGLNGQRTLTTGMGVQGAMTTEKCTAACFNGGFRLAGTEYSGECFCGNAILNGGAPAPTADCNMPCAGAPTQFCGGPARLNVYNYTGTALPAIPGGGGVGGGNPAPATGLAAPWTYGGCWIDNAHGRAMPVGKGGAPAQTVQTCIAQCTADGYTLAGIEYANECFCGNTLVNGAVIAPDAQCNMACSGNATQACGGPNRLSVYTSTGNVTALPVPAPQTTNLPGQWQYRGCLIEAVGKRIFDNQIIWPTNNSAVACMTQCAKFGFSASGTEYGQECYCGDTTDVTANNGVWAPEAQCDTPCPGDPTHICGSGNRLTTYFWNGTINDWKKPANTGRYEFLIPGVVVPLITTVGINNKVTFLEKHGTGFPNTTGAYELDISLAHNFSAAWREMHLKTDVFCAGSVILPDKAGRQINVGGWSLDSTFGVRLFTPNGVEGTNSTSDWEEDFNTLKLQRGRWYPTASVLANGTILVMGGQIGSNDKPEPSLELLPKPAGGSTVLQLPWLQRTDPNNLYPFIFILPSKNVFVVYYNEARILDPTTFQTVKELPNMPGAVNNFLGGRTYPLAGAAVPLPQRAPYTDPLEILVCGGSTEGGGQAIDNCVRSAPEAASPEWSIERMPSRRVMPNMVSMPDGTVMIMNGAFHGVAGFGLAEDPNLTAVLYSPDEPKGSRFSILNSTIVARMYHSEAALLVDGRVLVSGSDPQTNFEDGTPRYPEEFRVEVYVPPYLSEGRTQPTYTLPAASKDWAYSGSYTITNVKLFHGTTATMRVSLLAATSSTHGNTMGARTIFPAFKCNGATCTIIAPPNAGVSPPGWHMLFILDGPTPSFAKWVRIGGDPSNLGNWPNLPGFTLPGV